MTLDLAIWRLYCREHPHATVDLPAWELRELILALEAARRRAEALREHLQRRHGCSGECGEPDGH